MLDNPLSEEVAVDRREEVVSTEQPGYTSTQRVTQDAAGERRLVLFQFNRILFMALGVLEIMLGLRFFLKLLAADPGNGFASFIYGLTGAFTKPFDALLGTPAIAGQIFETTTLIAMCVYALVFGLVGRLILLFGDSPRVRSSARSVQAEQTPNTDAAINVDRIDRTDSPHILSPLTAPIVVSAPQRPPLFHAYSKFMRRQQHLIALKTQQARARLSAQLRPATATEIIVIQNDGTNAAESINSEQLPGDLSLDQIDRTNTAKNINVEQLPGDINLDQIVHTNPAENINVEQLPGDLSLAQIDRTYQAKILSVVKLPVPVEINLAKSETLIRSYGEFVSRYRHTLGAIAGTSAIIAAEPEARAKMQLAQEQAERINAEQLPGNLRLDQINHTGRPRIIRIIKSPLEVDAEREDPLLRSYREFVQRHQRPSGLAKPKVSLN